MIVRNLWTLGALFSLAVVGGGAWLHILASYDIEDPTITKQISRGPRGVGAMPAEAEEKEGGTTLMKGLVTSEDSWMWPPLTQESWNEHKYSQMKEEGKIYESGYDAGSSAVKQLYSFFDHQTKFLPGPKNYGGYQAVFLTTSMQTQVDDVPLEKMQTMYNKWWEKWEQEMKNPSTSQAAMTWFDKGWHYLTKECSQDIKGLFSINQSFSHEDLA